MRKRYIFEVVSDSQGLAEAKLEEVGFTNHYLLTTEPENDLKSKIKVLIEKMDDMEETEYLRNKYKALTEVIQEIETLCELAGELK